jgi:hypothetical protein
MGEERLGQVDADTRDHREVVGDRKDASSCIVREGLCWITLVRDDVEEQEHGETNRKSSTDVFAGKWVQF